MTGVEYQRLAQRTSNTKTTNSKIDNALLGLAGEVGELCDHAKKYLFQGHSFDRKHMIREAGDVAWYLAELAAGLGCTLDDIFQANIDKLEKRYPGAVFDAEKSIHRMEGDD